MPSPVGTGPVVRGRWRGSWGVSTNSRNPCRVLVTHGLGRQSGISADHAGAQQVADCQVPLQLQIGFVVNLRVNALQRAEPPAVRAFESATLERVQPAAAGHTFVAEDLGLAADDDAHWSSPSTARTAARANDSNLAAQTDRLPQGSRRLSGVKITPSAYASAIASSSTVVSSSTTRRQPEVITFAAWRKAMLFASARRDALYG